MPVQLFGTDISEKAIEKARAGFYPDGARSRRQRGAARALLHQGRGRRLPDQQVRARTLRVREARSGERSAVLEARPGELPQRPHLLRTRSCRSGCSPTFHFALNEPGFLLLGHAENIADGTNLFRLIDKDEQDLRQDRGQERPPVRAPPEMSFQIMPPIDGAATRRRLEDLVRRTESLLLDQYAPPGVIVNERMEILHFRGRTGPTSSLRPASRSTTS